MDVSNLTLPSLLRVLRFYRWAFGDLMVDDSDIGTIGEYLVGDALDCLPPQRKQKAPFDLVTKSGASLRCDLDPDTLPVHDSFRLVSNLWGLLGSSVRSFKTRALAADQTVMGD